MYCDGPEDCPSGQVCCGQLVQVTSQRYLYNYVKCATSCNYQQGQREFCHDNSQCSNGRNCHPSSLLSAYNVCG